MLRAPIVVGILSGAAAVGSATGAPAEPQAATYVVRLARVAPPAFVVSARWPGGTRLEMDRTRPGDLPALLEQSWPALVTRLHVRSADGRDIDAVRDGDKGWRLPEGQAGALVAEYEVDTRLLADNGWPAPREAVHAEDGLVSVVGRALFVTSDATRASRVSFDLPAGWRAWAPWEAERDGTFRAPTPEQLRENLVVVSRSQPAAIDASGMRVFVVPAGDWRPLEAQIARAVRAHVRRFVELMPSRGSEAYLAVLLPMRDGGAESYRESLALTFPDAPSRANEADWANLLGHEIFHHWNGWRLRGADYASTQWFQEGFTEYAANVSTVAAGLMTPEKFREKLAGHVANYRRLATSLENPGTRKGPPLYSGGALVAFVCDVSLRDATGGARGLGDVLRALWRRTGGGERLYGREDVVAALGEVAERDWTAFLDAHVGGTEPLPLAETFAAAGLRLVEPEGRKPEVIEDPQAGASARRIFGAIVRGR